MLPETPNPEQVLNHRSLIGALSVKNTEGLDVSVSLSNGSYRANIGRQHVELPMNGRSAKDILRQQCPSLSPRFADLLAMLLSHRSWSRTGDHDHPTL